MSLRKSSRRRKGSKSEVLPKPNARRRCTPAPSRVGLALMSRLTGRMDMLASVAAAHGLAFCSCFISPCPGFRNCCWKLAVKKGDKLGNDLIRRLVHQPVPRVLNDDALDVPSDQAALLDQELAGRFFPGQ